MKLFIDANLILDLILRREKDGSFNEMLTILDLAYHKKVKLYCASASFFFMVYILNKKIDKDKANKALTDLLNYIEPCPTFVHNIENGLNSRFKDKEDSFQYFAAYNIKGISFFLTRNLKDFAMADQAKPKVMSPKDFLKKLNP